MKTVVNLLFEAVRDAAANGFRRQGMPYTAQETERISNILEHAWNSANWYTQLALQGITVLALGSPLVLLGAALIGVPVFTAICTLLLLGAWCIAAPLFLISLWRDPLLIPLIAATARGQAAFKRLGTIIAGIVATEFLVGLYLSFVPLANDRMLVPGLLLAGLAWASMRLAGWKKLSGAAMAIVVLITLAFCFGGWAKFTGQTVALDAQGADGYHFLPDSRKIAVQLPVGWSDWQVFARTVASCKETPSRALLIQHSYTDGSTDDPRQDSPLIYAPQNPHKPVTALRFGNPGPGPATVILELAY